jgi:hypothetical protein
VNKSQRAQRIKTQREAIAKASGKFNGLFFLELYCDAPDCAFRQVRISVKDYDSDKRLRVKFSGLPCPLCGHLLKLHYAMDPREHMNEREKEARSSVACQMWVRDSGEDGIPLVLFLDDRLPPTPKGWWEAIGLTSELSSSPLRP